MSAKNLYIFISHSSEDTEYTHFVVDHLKASGIAVWVDYENIKEGSVWSNEIEKALIDSTGVIVIMSPNARESHWVENETIYALELKKPVFIAFMEYVSLPLYLKNRQFTDFRENKNEKMLRLIGRVEELLSDFENNIEHSLDVEQENLSDKALEPDSSSSIEHVEVSGSADGKEHSLDDVFLAHLKNSTSPESERVIAKTLYFWALEKLDFVEYIDKTQWGFHAQINVGTKKITIFSVLNYKSGLYIRVPFQHLKKNPPYDDVEKRKELLDQLNQCVPAKSRLPTKKMNGMPRIPLKIYEDTGELECFANLIERVIFALAPFRTMQTLEPLPDDFFDFTNTITVRLIRSVKKKKENPSTPAPLNTTIRTKRDEPFDSDKIPTLQLGLEFDIHAAGYDPIESSESSPILILYNTKIRWEIIFDSDSMMIGRRDSTNNHYPAVDLTPYDGYKLGVSRKHLSIQFDDTDGRFYVKDLGSANGTFINREKIASHETRLLQRGDTIRLGNFTLVVEF